MSLKVVFPAFPATEKGQPTHLKLDPKREKLVYGSGRMVIIRDALPPAGGGAIQTQVYTGHSYPVTAVEVAPSGCYVASGDKSGMVRVWACDNPDQILKLETPMFGGMVKDLSWSPDSQRLVGVGDGKALYGKVIMWDSGNSVGEITGHQKFINSCSYKPSRPFRIVTGGEDNCVHYYEGPPFKFKAKVHTHQRFVNTVRFSPSGDYFFSVSSDMCIMLYDGKTGEVVATKEKAHGGSIYSATWSPDSSRILTCSADKTAKVFIVPELTEEATLGFGDDASFYQVGCAWLPAGVLTYSLGGTLSLRAAPTDPQPALEQSGHSNAIAGMSLEPASGKIFTCSHCPDYNKHGATQGQLRLWDVGTGVAQAFGGKNHNNGIMGVAVCGPAVVTCALDSTIAFSPVAGGVFAPPQALPPDSGCPKGFSCSAGKLACMVTSMDKLLVATVPEGDFVLQVKLPFEPTCVSIALNESYIAVGGADKVVYIMSVDGRENRKLEKHRDAISCVAFSPAGDKLASGCANKEIVVWSVIDGTPLVTGLTGYHTARLACFGWSPDGSNLASGGVDGQIIVWDGKNAKHKIMGAHTAGSVTALIFTDASTLVSSGMDGCVKTWVV